MSRQVILRFVAFLIAVLGLLRPSSASYLSHVQNYVNLVSSYYLDGHHTRDFPPLQNSSHPMIVNLSMSLYAINGFDEVAGNIEIVSVLVITWTDEMPTIQSITFQKSGRDSFLVPYDMIWTPKLVLTNAIGDASEVGDSAYLCRFNMTSYRVTWSPRVVISAACTPDVTYYPFDKQTCSFEYTPWGFMSNEVLLKANSDEWDRSAYGESGEWDIAITSTETYINAGQSYIKFHLSIIRKPLYFAFNILLPVLVLCLLNSTVFLLPAESGERVGFSVTCFLTFVVLLNMIMDIMPRSSSPISFLCYYLVVMMANSGAMTMFTILLMRVYHKPEKSEVPKWLQRTVTFINCRCAKLRCCVLCCRYIRQKCRCENKRLCGCWKRAKTVSEEKLHDLTKLTKEHKKDHPTAQKTRFACFAIMKKLFVCRNDKEKQTDLPTPEPVNQQLTLKQRVMNCLSCKSSGSSADGSTINTEDKTVAADSADPLVIPKTTSISSCFSCFRKPTVKKLTNGDIESQLIATNNKSTNSDVAGRPDVKKGIFDKTGDINPSEKVLERWEDKRVNVSEQKADLPGISKTGKREQKKAAWVETIDESADDIAKAQEKHIDVISAERGEEGKLSKKDEEKENEEPLTDDSEDDSDEDSLADLEEEVKWQEVGRILDTFFFLSFLGGQIFFTIVFLVPLFTAP